MFLASFRFQDRDSIGARLTENSIVDLVTMVQRYGGSDWRHGALPDTMEGLIEADGDILSDLEKLLLQATEEWAIPLSAITWHPPVRRPGKIVGVAMNNSASDARKINAPSHPLFFIKPRSSLIGHEQPLELRAYYGSVHPEPELAVIIGKRARDLDPATALDAVFGYSILNDMTGNDMRGQDMVHYYALYASKADPAELERREQHLSYAARYKGTDGFGPMGPWLATRDEIPDPGLLDVTCAVGDYVIARDSTRYLTYSVAEILAFLSRFQTLEPGDIVSMGTAFRQQAGEKRSLHSANLQVVDGPVAVWISGIGTLNTPVVRNPIDLLSWRKALDN